MSENQNEHRTGHETHGSRHMLIMLLCCILPLVAIFALVSIFPGNPYLGFLALAICPLAMIFMMLPDMISRKKEKQQSCH